MANVVLTDVQHAILSIAPRDALGRPAGIDGVPTWDNLTPEMGTLTPAADGLSANFVPANVDGTNVATVNVTADVQLGEGVSGLSESFNITLQGANAVSLGASAEVLDQSVTPAPPPAQTPTPEPTPPPTPEPTPDEPLPEPPPLP